VNQASLDFTRTHVRTTDPVTSHAAAAQAESLSSKHCKTILGVLTQRGMTTEQISNYCDLDYIQVARRMTDLKRKGLVVDSGLVIENARGRNAIVWEMT
jgi:CRP-like cAMP-binding protein